MKTGSWMKSGAAVVASMSLLAVSPPLAMAGATSTMNTNATSTSGQQWTVLVGAGSKDASLQAMAFFPNVMTVDAGDTVNFKDTGNAPHTVTFAGSDGKLPDPTTPGWDQPAGASTYDGTTFTSSGMLMPGDTYSVTFSQPGVYLYHCLMHPGMQGVVIVQPTGTAYPMTQAQYDTLASTESAADLTAAQNTLSQVHVQSKRGPNGTTIWAAQSDLPELLSYKMNLTSQNNSHVSGTATLSMAKPGTWNVDVKLSGLNAGQTYTPALNLGRSDSGAAVPGSQFSSFSAKADGTAEVTGTVGALAIPQGIWFLDIHDGSNNNVADGVVNYLSFADERFLPDPINVHVGDTIVWTQFGANEAHTISFLPSGWKDIPDEGMMPAPAGGSIYPGNGFFNSGFLFPGQTYKLTFIKAGNFAYRCLLHDMMGMVGTVRVSPVKGISTLTWDQSVVNVPSKVHNDTTYMPIWYVKELLKSAGITSAWDGQNWKLTTSSSVNVGNVRPGTGSMHIYLNGQLVQNVNGTVEIDPNSGQYTTYMPVWYVMEVLKKAGFNGTWDGNTWDLSPSKHQSNVTG